MTIINDDIDKESMDIIKKYKPSDKETMLIENFKKETYNYLDYLYKFEIKFKHTTSSSFSKPLLTELSVALNSIIDTAFLIDMSISSLVVKKKLREFFRQIIGKLIFQSKIAKYAYDKPRGYHGDYLIFEMFYDNKPVSSDLGYYIDIWILNHPLVVGIRDRKEMMKKILVDSIGNNNKLDILNIGCGSCRELRELLTENKKLDKNIHFTCLDQDIEALRFADNNLRLIRKDVRFIKEDILTITGFKKSNKHLPPQNLIYSMGVADYFLENTLERFIKFCYSLLKPNGKLIIPLCSSYNPKLYIPFSFMCEWHLFTYNINTLKNIVIKKIGLKKVKVIWKEPNPFIYLIIER